MQTMPMPIDSRNWIVVCTMHTTHIVGPLHRYHAHQSILAHMGWMFALEDPGAEVTRVVTDTIRKQCGFSQWVMEH